MTQDPRGPSSSRGGEAVPPSARQLLEPPGDRYRSSTPGAGGAGALGTGSTARTSFLYGIAAAVFVALVWLVAGGILDVSYGLVAAGVLGGWVVGTAVAPGAADAGDAPEVEGRGPSRRVVAVALGLAGWLTGMFLAYAWDLATLPEAGGTLVERMAQVPFVEAVSAQYGPLAIVQGLAVGFFAWRTAGRRSAKDD